jgi:hypothetical protein
MNNFGQFNIQQTTRGFEGDKIKISKIMNREIIIHDFKIEDSKVKEFRENGTEKCLHLQIELSDEKRIVFTSSGGLMEAIQRVPKTGFPFTTTIVRDNDRFMFT